MKLLHLEQGQTFVCNHYGNNFDTFICLLPASQSVFILTGTSKQILKFLSNPRVLPTEMQRKQVMITDLDEPDIPSTTTAAAAASAQEPHRKTQRKRAKILQTMSGNFNRRSKSVECHLGERTTQDERPTKVQNAFHEVLHAKDKQMEQLLQRLTTLHKYNEQFATENEQLRTEVETLEQQMQELRAKIADCPNCHSLSGQLSKSVDDNKTLTHDVEMLKTLVFRLNVQIEHYQDQLRQYKQDESKHNSPSGESAKENACSKPQVTTWQGAVNTHTLAPLLKAYDEMINEKEQLIKHYGREFEHFTGELKRVIEENNRLLQHQEELKRDIGSWREERTRLHAQLNVCRTKAESQTHKTDLAKEKLVEVMHCYEQKTQSLALELDHTRTAYARCKMELANLKSLHAQPQDTIANALQECKDLLEELKKQHTCEKQALERTIHDLTETNTKSACEIERLNQEIALQRKSGNEQKESCELLQQRIASLQRTNERCTRSRDRLKARLRIALQWAQKLEEGQANLQSTWDALKRLEMIVKHKEAQVRGLHSRHIEEIDKMQKKLLQKEETIRTILKGKLTTDSAAH